MIRLLAVCLGNICRSPTAEAALREAAIEAGIDVEIDSAGTSGWHDGHEPDPRTRAAGAAVGLVVSGRSRQVTVDDFARFDLILAMDRDNQDDLLALAPDDRARTRVHLFRDASDAPGLDVPDPYHGGAVGFTDVVEICRRAAAAWIAALPDQAT